MKEKLIGSIAARVAAFFLLILSVWVTIGCVVAGAFMFDAGVFMDTPENVKQSLWNNHAWGDAYHIVELERGGSNPEVFYRNTNITFCLLDPNGEYLSGDKGLIGREDVFLLEPSLWVESGNPTQAPTEVSYKVYISVDSTLPNADEYSSIAWAVDLGYALRFWVFILGFVAIVLAVSCFTFLICAAGHRSGKTELTYGLMAKIPFDLFTVGAIALAAMGIDICGELMYGVEGTIIVLTVGGTVGAVFLTLYFMNLALRIKMGGWWRNTIIYRLCRLIWRGCKGLVHLIRDLPVIWETALVSVAVSLGGLLLLCLCCYNVGLMILLWLLANLIVLPLVFHRALTFRKLEKSAQALSSGDLSHHIDVTRMHGHMRNMGERLNSIGGGLAVAVEERLRSERMKTELITNVSHDIKTPLTSIINYSDLIEREPTDNEKITEYAGVLHRQSERLKKLIEDLVEVSKASTGNLEVLLAPCEVNMLLSQAAGEYQEKMERAELTLVTDIPEQPLHIMADGRRMWRVLDNLMNNACKYAMPGTRVYLTLVQREHEAVITFKNVSQNALNISPDELMERFVRGDSSRNTEGSGLGLSIAKSLAELQGGKLGLSIDGDLFKAELSFPLI